MSLVKKAVDQAAKDYWRLLWDAYGEQLVKDIPRRIKAALVANKKVASIDESADVRAIAAAKVDTGSVVEGVYHSDGAKLLFRANLDKEGNVSEIQTINLK